MFEVRSHYPKGSVEYDTLSYRIRCGQLYQQNAIDKAKGIICKPMPRTWHDRHAANKMEDDVTREFYRNIVADKKPYFMRYIYPALMKQYNQYIKNTNRNCLREFQLTVDELRSLPANELTERQSDFLRYYDYRMPVGTGDCVMNKICRRFEQEFDGYIRKHTSKIKFDYTIMKNPSEEYTTTQFKAIKKLYEDYNKKMQSYAVFAQSEKIDKYDAFTELSEMNAEFRKSCDMICQNESALCNIVLDLCYQKSSSKRFAWNMCGSEIIHNLLLNHDYTISFPTLTSDGTIEYCGEKFEIVSKKLEVNE